MTVCDISAFERALAGADGSSQGLSPEQQVRLRALMDSAREAYPEFFDDADRWLTYVAERTRGLGVQELLVRLHPEDLTVARACALNLPGAIQALEARCSGAIGAIVCRFATTHAADDLRQVLRKRLFVAEPGCTPKIADYTGHGALASWVRVTAVRAFLDLGKRRDRAREVAADDDEILRLPDTADDLELDFLKREYRGAFVAAARAAALALSPQDRNLLRQHYTGGLSIDRLAALYSIHRATAARRVAAARQRLLEGTRAQLADRLVVDDQELSSIMTLIASRVDISVRRLFATGGA